MNEYVKEKRGKHQSDRVSCGGRVVIAPQSKLDVEGSNPSFVRFFAL